MKKLLAWLILIIAGSILLGILGYALYGGGWLALMMGLGAFVAIVGILGFFWAIFWAFEYIKEN